jgi:hypothetical protein
MVTDAAGTPVTGGAAGMSFEVYKDDTGTNVTAPSIVEIAGGLYKFVPNLSASPSRGIVYVLNTGAGRLPARYWRYIRPEDWSDDTVVTLRKTLTNRSKIHTTGPEANRLVIYDDDGTTVLLRFDLKDVLGIAGTTNPFEKIPA